MRRETLGMLCFWLLAGCEPDPGLRIEIRGEGFQRGVNIDELRLDLVASQNEPTPSEFPEDYVYPCRIASEVFSGDRLVFPLIVTVRPGEILWECVGIRARGSYNGEVVIRAEDLFCEDLHSGVTPHTLSLDVRCLPSEERTECLGSKVCQAGQCVESRAASVFEATAAMSQPCDVSDQAENER